MWEKPEEENGIITQYDVQLRHMQWRHKCNYPVQDKVFHVSAQESELQMHVEASSKYKVSVTAVTIKAGDPAELTIHTKESIPDAQPQNLHVNNRMSRQLMPKWDKPPCQLTRGDVSSYILTYKGEEPWDDQKKNLTLTLASGLLSNLIPYTTYVIHVYACTVIGCSEKYAETRVTTHSEVPPQPTNVTIYRTTQTTLSVTWKPPYPPYGKLLSYNIYFKERNEHVNHYKKINATQSFCNDAIREGWICYTLTELLAQRCYSIHITVENEVGQNASSEVSGETEESVPGPPSSIQVNSSTETSLEVIWQEPHLTNGNLTGYRLNATVVDSFSHPQLVNTQIQTVELTGMTLNVTDLLPATTYNVSVSASTKKGFGLAVWGLFTTRNAEPEIRMEPEVGLITKNTVDLMMKPLIFTDGPISAYFILVREMGYSRRRRRSDLSLLVDFNTSQANGLMHYATARFLPSEVSPTGLNVTVGDGRHYGGYYNAPLATGQNYNFGVAVLSNFSGDARVGYRYISRSITVQEHLVSCCASTTGAVVGSIVILILLCIVAVLFIIYKKPNWLQTVKRGSISKFQMMNQNQGNSRITESMLSLETAIVDTAANHVTSRCIPVSRLESYVHEMSLNGALEEEYKSVGRGVLHPVTVAKLPENKSKNRYGNLLPYDYSRVLIERTGGDNFSDYINANYISGYQQERKYIATQGPKQHTLADLWNMIWQEGVIKIIMTTNLNESGRTKCEKYWPDTSERYGKVMVTLLDTEMYADYVIRTLQVNKGEQQRQVKHFHFTSWPDHGVPLYPVAIGGFLKLINAYNPESEGPIVVHCSAGVGRTGTIILVDSMIGMGKAEGQVDVLGHLYKIRQQRMSLVETYEQYQFVHKALADILCGEETSVLCSEYYSVFGKLQSPDPKSGLTPLQTQYQRLEKLCPPLRCEDCRSGYDILNSDKNRSTTIVPPDRSRYLLPTSEMYPSNYINAVYINGYKQKDAFIVTQVPLENTVIDFWRMVHSSNTSTIVLMNGIQSTNEKIYWPEATSEKYGSLTVEHIDSDVQGEVVTRTFNLKSTDKTSGNSSHVVKQFHLQSWHCNEMLPSSGEVIIDMIEKVERWQKQSRSPTVIVQCVNGVCASGVFCASVFTCDKIKIEQEVDVFLAVRSIRHNRPQFIQNLEQYNFIHQVASTFLDSFETYANFQ